MEVAVVPALLSASVVSKTPRLNRIQVFLECDRPTFIAELDHDVNVPRAAADGVRARSRVVFRQTCIYRRREARVVTTRCLLTSQDVNESFGERHARK
jgi:hypothetical protein